MHSFVKASTNEGNCIFGSTIFKLVSEKLLSSNLETGSSKDLISGIFFLVSLIGADWDSTSTLQISSGNCSLIFL